MSCKTPVSSKLQHFPRQALFPGRWSYWNIQIPVLLVKIYLTHASIRSAVWTAVVRNDFQKEWKWNCIITNSFIILTSRTSELILRMTVNESALTLVKNCAVLIIILVFGSDVNRRPGLKAWLPVYSACVCVRVLEIPFVIVGNNVTWKLAIAWISWQYLFKERKLLFFVNLVK